jgi:hypothetical protein
MSWIKRVLCSHKWKTHAKEHYSWHEKIEGTWNDYEKVGETIEILICEKCGKIKKN